MPILEVVYKTPHKVYIKVPDELAERIEISRSLAERYITFATEDLDPNDVEITSARKLYKIEKVPDSVTEVSSVKIRNRCRKLLDRAYESELYNVVLAAEAYKHYHYGIRPETKHKENLGYYFADEAELTKEESDLISELFGAEFISNYIFAKTRYDCCSNGHYYRMS